MEKNPAQQVMEEVMERLEGQGFESLEQANEFTAGFMDRKNSVPQMDFLGLSSEETHRMLHYPLETLEDMVRFNHALEAAAFREIPVVKNTMLFLTRLKQLEPLRATAKGNLPRAFARELHNKFLVPGERFHGRIRSEWEAIFVNSLRHVLRMCGWLKKAKNRYSLTAKGTKLIQKGFSASHFFTLMNVFVRRFNWAFQDRYPQFWIIQKGAVFSLYMLHLKARQFVSARQLGDSFVRAFPAALGEAESTVFSSPAEEIRRCFSLRFLERFCEYFGLVVLRRKNKEPYEWDLSVKKSAFYDQYINWT